MFVIGSKKTRKEFTEVVTDVKVAEVPQEFLEKGGRELGHVGDVHPEDSFSSSKLVLGLESQEVHACHGNLSVCKVVLHALAHELQAGSVRCLLEELVYIVGVIRVAHVPLVASKTVEHRPPLIPAGDLLSCVIHLFLWEQIVECIEVPHDVGRVVVAHIVRC